MKKKAEANNLPAVVETPAPTRAGFISIGKSGEILTAPWKIKASSPLPPKSQRLEFTPAQKFTKVDVQNYRKALFFSPVLYWGELNKYPSDVDFEARKCNVLEAGLKKISDYLYGQGFYLYKEVFEGEERKTQEVNDTELMNFLYDVGYYEYYEKACRELPRWGNLFPVYLLNANKKIAQIQIYDAAFCRLERPDIDTANIENIYVSAQWPHGLVVTSEDVDKDPFLKKWVQKIPLLDEFNYLDQLQHTNGVNTWAQHLKYHTSGHAYGRVPWHACYDNRYTAISWAVPEMKMRLFEYAMCINYVIYIHEDYWRSKFPNGQWDEFEDTVRSQKIKDMQNQIEKELIGVKKSYKTLFASMNTNDAGVIEKQIIIETINNTQKIGDYIPDAQIADSEIIFSLGLDPTLMGMGGMVPGGQNSQGSGSNIREATLALNANLRSDREIINTPFYVMRDFMFPNKKDIKIGVRDYVINTLDNRAPAAGATVTQ